MVLLLSAVAVVVAAVLIVAWFVVGGGFALIYGAIALAVVSMLLLWAARWIGSTREAPARTEPAALPRLVPLVAALMAADQPRRAPAPTTSTAVPPFPIADYDSLWVSQIVPILAGLDRDELAVVEARERGSRHRAAVLDAIAGRRGTASAPVGLGGHDPRSEPARAAPAPPQVVEAEVSDGAGEPLAVVDQEVVTDGDGPAEGERGADTPHVRTFLGNRRSTVTVRRG